MTAFSTSQKPEEASLAAPPVGWSRLTRPRNCTFAEGDWEVLAKQWFPIARVQDVEEKPVATKLLDVKLVVYRTGEYVHVARDLCPHRGVPLSMGWVEGDEIVCAYHGLRYATDGRCTRIPAQPNVVPSERFRATILPAVLRYGLVWTSLDAESTSVGIPEFPEWSAEGFQPILCPPVSIQAAAGRQIEGFIDVAHFAWIHHEAFADRENSVVPLYQTKKTDYGFRSLYISDVSNFPKSISHLAPEGFVWHRTFDVYPPFIAMLKIDFPEDGLLRIMNIATPVSASETTLYVPLARNFDQTGSLDDVYAFNAQIFAEDQAIIEAQCPEDLPLELDEEAHFAADRSSVAYRKALKDMGLTGRT
jgi:vanillate O-demethylase monooxygenase subunit